jgi:oxygen-independent coproporphyrinogen-3 oxidase
LEEVAALGLGPDAAIVRDLVGAGLLNAASGRLTATPGGRLVLDRLTAELATAAAPMAETASAR